MPVFVYILILVCNVAYYSQSIRTDIPSEMYAGGVYTVQIIIHRRSVSENFSKYYMNVPREIMVKEMDVMDGVFAFEPTQKRAKVIWSVTPPEQELKLLFILSVLSWAEGESEIIQKYSYIEGEQKKEITAAPVRIRFIKEENVPGNKSPASSQMLPDKSGISASVNKNMENTGKEFAGNIFNSKEKKSSYEKKNFRDTVYFNREYKIQILATSVIPNPKKFRKFGKISIYQENGLYKVMVGSFDSREKAMKKLEEIKAGGMEGFVVLFENGVKK